MITLQLAVKQFLLCRLVLLAEKSAKHRLVVVGTKKKSRVTPLARESGTCKKSAVNLREWTSEMLNLNRRADG